MSLKPLPNGTLGFQLSSSDSKSKTLPSHILSASLLPQKSGHTAKWGLILPSIDRIEKQTSHHPNVQLFHTGSLEQGPKSVGEGTKGRNEAQLSEQIKTLDFKDGRSWRTSMSRSSSQSCPQLQEVQPGALAFSASALYSSDWREREEDSGPSGRAPSPPPEKHSSAEEEICCHRFGRGGRAVLEASRPGCWAGAHWRGNGQRARSVSHSADLTPRLPLTYGPRCRHLPRCGSRHCGRRDSGPALASTKGSPVCEAVFGLLAAATAAELPLEPRPQRRRSLITSSPSKPFGPSPAHAAGGGRGSDGRALGAGFHLPSASGGARFPAPRDVSQTRGAMPSVLALRLPPGASLRVRTQL